LGWYALILAETLALLPSTHPTRPQLLEIAQRLAAGLQQTQHHQTGLWYQVVDKGDHDGNWHDTSGSAMFVYFLQRMIDLGYLDAEQYRPSAERGYAGIVSKIAAGSDGLVDIYDACDGVCVQRSYADYINYPKRINAKEALGSVYGLPRSLRSPAECSAVANRARCHASAHSTCVAVCGCRTPWLTTLAPTWADDRLDR